MASIWKNSTKPGVVNTAKDTIDAPITNLVSAISGAGVLTGTYYYTVSFVTTKGETSPWIGTATPVACTSNSVSLTAIPIGTSGVIARKLWRTTANPVDPKDYKFLTTISDNTTTTYTDNTPDGSLGSPVSWTSTNRGILLDGTTPISRASGQTVSFGVGALQNNSGYASVAIGFNSLNACTSGRRNTAVGVYSLTSLTTGYENTALGVHSGQYTTAGIGNTFVGYTAGFNAGLGVGSGLFNTAVGKGALNGTASGIGQQNTAIGLFALSNINTADSCVGIGAYAGQYANASRQLFIDTGGNSRANLAAQQDAGLIYGKAEASVTSQVLNLNAMVRIGPPSITVSQLPTPSAALTGYRAFVTDATASTFASAVVGGGSIKIPVFCDGVSWLIG